MTDSDGYAALHHSARNDNYEFITYFTGLGTNIHL